MHTHKSPLTVSAVAAGLAALAGPGVHADLFQAPTGPGGEWKIYDEVRTGLTFAQAIDAAAAAVDPVDGTDAGHLVAIGSLAENQIVHRMVGGGDVWIGLSDREGVAPGAQESQTFGDDRFTMGWAWTNGEAFTFQNWAAPGEPNDFNGAEDAAHIRGDGLWNDNGSGFAENLPVVPTLQPGTSLAEGAPAFNYVIEFPKMSATPFPGIPVGSAAFMTPARLPGPDGGLGTWGVREVRDVGVGNLIQAVDNLASGGGTITDGSFPILDTTDPDTNAAGGPILQTPPNPYLTDTPGVGDDNIHTSAKGTIRIDEPGDYTFQVRSDDGFALRIRGQSWSSVSGAGQIDPFDPEAIVFTQGTGDANTRGVVNLAAGTYDVDFVNWEGGGGAYYELTAAKGAFADAGTQMIGENIVTPQWIAVGDSGTVLPEQVFKQPIQLNSAVTVANLSAADAGNNLDNIAETRAAFAGAAGTHTAEGTADHIVINDGGFCCGRPGEASPLVASLATLYPINNDPPAILDEFGTRVTGSFTVLDDGMGTAGDTINVSFGLYADDGAQLRIIGQDFISAWGGPTGTEAVLLDAEGDISLTADIFTGNTTAHGLIELTEGQSYDFEIFNFEGGGGAGLEVLAAFGDRTGETFLDGGFFVLSTTAFGDQIIAGNAGIALVPEPSTSLLGLLGLAGFLLRRRRN